MSKILNTTYLLKNWVSNMESVEEFEQEWEKTFGDCDVRLKDGTVIHANAYEVSRYYIKLSIQITVAYVDVKSIDKVDNVEE